MNPRLQAAVSRVTGVPATANGVWHLQTAFGKMSLGLSEGGSLILDFTDSGRLRGKQQNELLDLGVNYRTGQWNIARSAALPDDNAVCGELARRLAKVGYEFAPPGPTGDPVVWEETPPAAAEERSPGLAEDETGPCPYCGLTIKNPQDAERPADYCGHDTADIVEPAAGETRMDFGGGKYTVVLNGSPDAYRFEALRYGEPWRNLVGDNLILAMVHEIGELRKAGLTPGEREAVLEEIGDLTKTWDKILSDPQLTGPRRTAAEDHVSLLQSAAAKIRGEAGALPKINIKCVSEPGTSGISGLTGTTYLNVVKVEAEDDGSFTAVTDHWPVPPDAAWKDAASNRFLVSEDAETRELRKVVNPFYDPDRKR